MAEVPNIAAAANIKFAMAQLVNNYQQQSGNQLRVSYGSSGNFVAQIKHGAPFQLFLSADEKYVEALASAGLTADHGVVYAYGRLALVAPNNSPLTLDTDLDGLSKLLQSGQLQRFAIANPEHAPYGERARQLLQQKGLWQALQPSIVYGENVSQAAQFALSGSTQGGIVALSLAMAPQFRERGRFVALPTELHNPLTQRMVLLKGAGDVANDFYRYLQSEPARAVFRAYGFALPEEGH
ncbi:molybdate ABC transporter substrate-binding protein [Shewanella dokdonensis]|nr:molybdate ABC transporter substrate-binding protein [Shewanella dokdonensis]MCL1076178.1 molybdate ABC transporter substrate-binding protein [Shewanella dokdonensis]